MNLLIVLHSLTLMKISWLSLAQESQCGFDYA
ncbi:hypothetical protein EM595_2143 [Duffyella gerundensis]|uniref:Uncharacterized protein n=1 Tax=Duffyella gerundensis TaxID=1619313 RepID=A0A0U5L0Y6_9GAMM|nr:hypothetical protein EM595_2143 [Duffyella gerundensis]